MGRRVELPGRGTTFVREVPGPPGAPVVVLVHGLMASAGLNWFRAFEPLGEHFRVIAPDLRGHGRGLRSRERFRLEDCADDVAALADALDVDRFIVAGYSLGGPVSLLTWRRHRSMVDGIVLCATGSHFIPVARERLVFMTMAGVVVGTTQAAGAASWLPSSVARRFWPVPPPGARSESFRQWAMAEMRRHDWQSVMHAMRAVGVFDARRWIDTIDVPAAVVVTTEDRAVSPRRQRRLAELLGATVHECEGGHAVCARRRFGTSLLDACLSVASRI